MQLAVPCPICKSISPCECKQALISFFAHTQRAYERVLRQEASSKVEHLPVIGGGVDKLIAYFKEPIQVAEILAKAKHLNYLCQATVLNDKKHYLKVAHEEQSMHLKYSLEKSHVVNMITNPNRFKTWEAHINFIQSIFAYETIKSAKSQRLDLNLDFATPLPTLIQSLDIKNKKCAQRFIDEAGSRTGLIIGKGKETIEIYDKALKDGLNTPYTRLELRLGTSKLKIRDIFEIPSFIQNSKTIFNTLEGVNLNFLSGGISDAQSKRLDTFKMILEREGLYTAKKELNKERNFDRDFSKLVEFKKWDLQPSQLFKNEIARFFETKEGGGGLH